MSATSFGELFERVLVPGIFRPWGIDLLDRVRIDRERVLDVACGTGIIARLVRERGHAARIAGVDLNPGMIAVARSLAPEIEWKEGNAVALPFPDAAFDLIVCQQGLQFFPDRERALREMRRVLTEGGRVALTTRRPIEECPLSHALHTLAAARFGPHVDRRFSLGDASVITALLASAGFHEIRAETVTRNERIADARVFVSLNLGATVDALDELNDEARARAVEAFHAEAADVLARFAEGTEIVHPISANLASARA